MQQLRKNTRNKVEEKKKKKKREIIREGMGGTLEETGSCDTQERHRRGGNDLAKKRGRTQTVYTMRG